jgi:hypothetical protein
MAELLALTRLVGMECPGLRSIFQSFNAEFHPRPSTIGRAPKLAFQVSKFDERFGLATIEISGPTVLGSLQAFVRPAPQVQATMQTVRGLVVPSEFAGQHALIIGGSRGLGETSAKIVAAGGGVPIITYLNGADDAKRVADEVQACDAKCEVMRCDVRSPGEALDQVIAAGFSPSQVYYFATPKIGLKKRSGFSRSALNDYLDIYVDAFAALYREFRARWSNPVSVFYPSTVFVDEVSGQLDEYAAAKAAGETICRYIAERDPNFAIIVERLPRISTDQTLTLVGRPSADALPTLLPIVRRMTGAVLQMSVERTWNHTTFHEPGTK